MLDLKTLMILYLITNLINAGTILAIWQQNRNRFKGILEWLAGMVLQVLGSMLLILRGKIPDLLSMTGSNTLVLAGSLLILIGLQRFTGKRVSNLFNYLVLACFALVSAYFVVASPNLQVRDIALSVMLIFFSAQSGLLIFRQKDLLMRKITRLTGIVFVAYCCFSIARIALNLTMPSEGNDFFHSGNVNSAAITIYIVLNLALTISLVLMVTKRLMESIVAQEMKFSMAFQTSPYATTLTRASNGEFLETNDAFTSMTGYTREEALANSSIGLHIWADPQDRGIVVSELLKGASIKTKEFLFRKKDGEILTGLFSAQIVSINNETLIFSSISDISDRKVMENKLKQEQLFSNSVIDSLPGVFYLYSYPDLTLLQYNKNHETVLGFDPGELKGMSIRNWKDEESRQILLSAVDEVMEKGKVRIETTLLTKAGTKMPFILTGVKLEIYDNIYIMGVGIDITRLKEAEKVITLKNEELSLLNAEKDKFFSIIAHDLRSPFNAFFGLINMLIEDLPTMKTEEIKDIALVMRTSVTNVYRLLENLLEWSRMSRGLTDFQPQKIAVAASIRVSLDLIQYVAEAKHVKIINLIPDHLDILSDKYMFETVMRNLIFNAIKFSNKGGKVIISAQQLNEEFIQVSVADNGIGMNKDIFGKIFHIDEKASRKGTEGEPSSGLGLIICKEFVERMGGKIWAESQENKGSTFHFTVRAS